MLSLAQSVHSETLKRNGTWVAHSKMESHEFSTEQLFLWFWAALSHKSGKARGAEELHSSNARHRWEYSI